MLETSNKDAIIENNLHKVDFLEQAVQIFRTLSANIIKIDSMTDDMNNGHNERPESDILVHNNSTIKRYESMKECFTQECDQIPAHCYENCRKCEHYHTGRATSECHPPASHLSQSRAFIEEGVICR